MRKLKVMNIKQKVFLNSSPAPGFMPLALSSLQRSVS